MSASKPPNDSTPGVKAGAILGRWSGVDAVTEADIRRRMEVLEWDCPLHANREQAIAHGYQSVISPSTMYMTWSLPAYWTCGEQADQEELLLPKLPMATALPEYGDQLIDTECFVEFGMPVYPGDLISAVSRLISVTPKKTRVGEGAFFVVESTYTNDRGEVVAVDQVTLFRYRSEAADE